jgi:DNA polymerase V
MANIQIIQGDFEKKLKLQFAPGIRAGFPSPAEDYNHDTLDFNRDLIRNPEATFYGKVEGDSMIEAGINDGDIAVIDRSLEPRDGDIVVGYINEEFTIKYLDLNHHNDGYIELRPANKDFIRKEVSSSWELGLTVQFSKTCLTQMLNSLRR